MPVSKFPFGVFHPFSSLPVPVRLGILAKHLLQSWKPRKLKAKPRADYTLATMAGQSHVALLRETLYSFAYAAAEIPPLKIINDGSLTESTVHEVLDFWPSEIELIDRKSILDSLTIRALPELENLINHSILNLKLAGLISLSSEGPVFFTDSDILWFEDPTRTIMDHFDQPGLVATREHGCNVNESLAERYAPGLVSEQSINSGCVLINMDLQNHDLINDILKDANRDPGHRFNEQTTIGILAEKMGAYFNRLFCMVRFEDAAKIRRFKPWANGYTSRHYVNWMRHQFYRDALRLRFWNHIK